VTKVTVEYASAGKLFTVVFDPTKVDAIVLGKTDLERLQAKQNELAEANPSVVKPVKNRPPLKASRPIPGSHDGDKTFATSAQTGTDSTPAASLDVNRSLWWHTAECGWFHPEED
jgi:hypothetical protein